MSKLVAVKRMDKTGKLVTRHIRTDSAPSATSEIPPVTASAPSAASAKEAKALAKRIKRLDARLPMSFRRDALTLRANERLRPWFREVYAFSCTGNELYDMLTKLSASDAIVLTAVGVKPDQIDTMIRKQRWDDLIVDNSELVDDLRTRGVDPRDYIEVALDDDAQAAPMSALVEAAEAKTFYGTSNYDGSFGARKVYSSYLLKEQIHMSDLKEIGLERCADTEGFSRLLLRLKKGESICTAREISEMLDRSDKKPAHRHQREYERLKVVSGRANLAMLLGVEVAESAKNPPVIVHAAETALSGGFSTDKAREFCEYINEVFTEDYAGSVDQYGHVDVRFGPWKEMQEVGIPHDKIIEGARSEMTAQQIIAVHSHGIEPSVSEGWL